MAEPITNTADIKHEFEPSTENIKIVNGSPPPVPDVAVKDAATSPVTETSPMTGTGCKKHDKMDGVKKNKSKSKKRDVDE